MFIPGTDAAFAADLIVMLLMFGWMLVLRGKQTRWRFFAMMAFASLTAKLAVDIVVWLAPSAFAAPMPLIGFVFSGLATGAGFVSGVIFAYKIVTTPTQRATVQAQASEETNIELARRMLRSKS